MSVSLSEINGTRTGEVAQPLALADSTPAVIRAELERILSSAIFRNAKGQSRFLRYVVDQSLDGRAQHIKEYSIGVEVFGRGDSFDPRNSNIVRTEANRLRTKLAKYYDTEGRDSTLRIDLPKGGYTPFLFSPAVASPEPVADLAAEPSLTHIPAELEIAAGRQARPRWFSSRLVAGALMILVAGGAAAGYRWLGQSQIADAPSIVVLPFVNLSRQSDEFMSDGLTDELINSLGRVPGLHVVARTSAFQYKGKNLDVRKIGRELNVRNVLEGTVRQEGDRVRIAAQLDDATNGYRVWSGSFDRDSKDVLAMQREISLAIVDAFSLQLTSTGRPPLASHEALPAESMNPEAAQSYLKGVYFSNKHTGEYTQRAISFFEDAIAKAPGHARSYSGLARCYSMLPSFTTVQTLKIAGKWKAAAMKALELDPALGEAHIYLGENYMTGYDWVSAEREFKAGLIADPGDADGYRAYSLYLARTGKLSEAIAQARKAVDLDPVSPFASNSLAKYLYQSRRFDEAIEQYRTSLQLDPNDGIGHQGLALVYLRKKMYREAIGESEACSRIMNGDPFITGQLGYAYAISGNSSRAREILVSLTKNPDPRGTFPLAIANVYLGLKEKDRALEWLAKAVDQHEVALFVQSDPIYDPLRSDPRFALLLHKMNLK